LSDQFVSVLQLDGTYQPALQICVIDPRWEWPTHQGWRQSSSDPGSQLVHKSGQGSGTSIPSDFCDPDPKRFWMQPEG
jgi:hypothetical protein